MARRSRLRTREDKRRWLAIALFIVVTGVGGVLWYLLSSRPDVLDQLVGFLPLKQWQSSKSRDFIRGTIYDRNYKELAVSYERVSVYANIREIESLESVVVPLARVLEEPKSVIRERLHGSGLRLWLARDISQKQEDEIRQMALPGIFLHKEFVRYHPQKETAAHLLGFVENDTGLSGVEFYLNQLQAKHRIYEGEVEALEQVGEAIPGPDGRHLILTLDLKIQHILDQYVEKQIDLNAAHQIGVIAIEADTGAIVGYAQRPSFDPNRFHTYPETSFDDIFNQHVAVPESIKVFLRDVSLLESHSDAENMPWSIAHEKRKLGVQLQLWEKLGTARAELYDFISAPPSSPDRLAFDKTGTGHRDFETVPVMLTPLQLLTSLARSANGGKKIELHAADRYIARRNQEEYLLEHLQPSHEMLQLQANTIAEISYLLEAIGRNEQLNAVIVNGQSTSYSEENETSLYLRHHLSFALIPIPGPELILMAVSNGPGYDVPRKYGVDPTSEISRLIAPIAARQQVMKNLADMMKPRVQEEKNFMTSVSSDALEKDEKTGTQEVRGELIKMPNLVGMSLRKSLRLLQNSEVEIKVKGTGRVVGHDPPAGTDLLAGSLVVLHLQRDVVDGGFRNGDTDVSKNQQPNEKVNHE